MELTQRLINDKLRYPPVVSLSGNFILGILLRVIVCTRKNKFMSTFIRCGTGSYVGYYLQYFSSKNKI